MLLMSPMVLLQQYFNRRRALAVSIASIGFSVGGLTFGPLTVALLEAYAIRGTLLIIGAMYFQMSVFCCLFRPAPGSSHAVTGEKMKAADSAHGTEEMVVTVTNGESRMASKPQQECEACEHSVEQSDAESNQHHRSRAARLVGFFSRLFADLFDFSLLRSVPFQLFLVSSFCLFVGFSTFIHHMPSRAALFGVEPWLISVLPTLICSATVVSRLVFSFVANMSCTSLLLQFAVSMTLSGMVQSMMFLTTTFEMMALYCALLGTINGQ